VLGLVLLWPGQGWAAELKADDFNRNDGGLGANWTTLTGQDAPLINGNAVGDNTIAGFSSHAMYTGITWPNDQYVFATVKTLNTDINKFVGLWVRALTTEITGYFILITGPANSSSSLTVLRYNNGTQTVLFGPTAKTLTVGQVVKVTIINDTITVFYDDVDKTGPIVDNTPIASGSPGLYVSVAAGVITDAQLDNWGAGAMTSGASQLLLGVGN
jgi:hypothetical protein